MFSMFKEKATERACEKKRIAIDRLKDSAIEMARYALKETDIERRSRFIRKFEEYLHRLEVRD